MRTLAATALTGLALTCLVACSNDDEAAADPDPACGDRPELEVTKTGSEPHRELDLQPQEGQSATMDLMLDGSMSSPVDGSTSPSGDAPTITLGLVATVDDVTDDEIAMSFEYDKASVDGDHAFEKALKTVVGTSGTFTTDANGVYLDASIEAAPGLAETMQGMVGQFEQQLAALTVPLPSEEIGLGAEWQVTTPIEINGVETCNAYTYTLSELDGSQYALDVDISQEMAPGTHEESGIEVTVIEGSAAGTGTVRGDLAMPLAVSGSRDVDSSTSLELDLSETRQVETDTHLKMTIDPRE